MIKKNEEYIVDIIDNGYEGEGIAKIDGFTVFIDGAIKGEKCKILILKVTTSHGFGKIIEILEKSPNRIQEDCSTYRRCGGCTLRHIDYQETLNMKRNVVQNLVNKILANRVEVNKTMGMNKPYNYRNKAQYPLGYDKDGQPVIGIFAQRTHEIISMQNCKIQSNMSEDIAKYIFEFIKDNNIPVYNEKTRKGIFRHIVIRSGFNTDEIMCILVINEQGFNKEEELVSKLIRKYSNIKTIVKNINMKNTNVILGNKNINMYGPGHIYDTLGEYKFKISPMSFYQTNPIQTEVLYNKAIELSQLDKQDILFDLYCGIGTIGIFASKYVKQVYGIEIVADAIKDAKENAKINKVDNIQFICGDVENVFEELIDKEKSKPNVIFVDPPRRGLDNKTINNILKLQPKKVIYISCNPATLVRDLKLLEEKYNTQQMQPVDMFPYTSHVECVCLLEIKETI